MALPALSDLTADAPPDRGASERLRRWLRPVACERAAGCRRAWASVGRDFGRWPERMVANAVFVAVVPSAPRHPIITVACDGW